MSKRLAGYDYSQPGFYFVTICVQQHRSVFGAILDGQMHLKPRGEIARSVWMTLPRRYPHVKLDEYIFMPNHMHGIIELTDIDKAEYSPRAALWEVVRVFKAVTSYQVRRSEGQPWFAWHEEYHDEIIRSETALHHIREYIVNNPARWAEDELYRRY